MTKNTIIIILIFATVSLGLGTLRQSKVIEQINQEVHGEIFSNAKLTEDGTLYLEFTSANVNPPVIIITGVDDADIDIK